MKIANVVLGRVGCKPNWSRLCDWLRRSRPEIVTLQKIGSQKNFPKAQLRKIGYESICLRWRSASDPGVAILSNSKRLRPEEPVRQLRGDEQPESRFLTVNIGDLSVSSVYAPFNPEGRKSDEAHKAIELRVAWLNRLRNHVEYCGYHRRHSVLCGDFNVKFKADGRREDEIWYSQDEEDALRELLELGYCDLYRAKHRNSAKNNLGRTRGYSEKHPNGTSRLHLILASMSLRECLRSACVDIISKPWPRKDAPPLIVDLDDI